MTETLISLDTAILAKTKGFDWPTNAVHARLEVAYLLPTQALLAKWLRDHHYIFITVVRETIGSDEWVFAYRLDYLPKEYWEAKRRCPHFQVKESFSDGFGTYSGGWDTFEEALENALKHSLELL